MRIVVHSPFAVENLTAALGGVPDVDVVVARTKNELAAALPDADALAVTASLYDEETARAVKSASGLRWIHFITSGVDPLTRFPPPPLTVTNSAIAWAPTVAEHAVAMLLALQRGFLSMQAAKAQGKWTQLQLRTILVSLEATTVVLLGFGAIAQQIARLIKPFGSRVIAVARSERSHREFGTVLPVARLDSILSEADAVVAALPNDPSTHHLMDARRLGMLPPHTVIVNVGRGETFDENALAEALRYGRLGGAALDVFEREPLAADSPLWKLENVIISPHVAGMGRSRLFERLASLCADNARRFTTKELLVGRVEVAAAR